ncbi:MAG: 5-methyltetrahydropteroyltriglutamate--homocysteine S-methyltransferase [Rhodospirillaceae bacterium]|jgi:5-methyltetrahydropteroyltriglutamate--homocysteine methyltransferase
MTARLKPPFRADIVGSFLRPEKLKDARRQAGMDLDSTAELEGDGSLSQEQLREIENDCIREIIEFQGSIGLKAVTDGEFRRGSWAYDFVGKVDGIDLRRPEVSSDATFSSGFQPPVAHAVGKVKQPKGGIFIQDWKYASSLTNLPVKATMPSPTIMFVRGGRKAVNEEIYPDLEEFFEDLTGVYRDEISDLVDLGATYIQIDNTDAALLCDPKFQEASLRHGLEPSEQIKLQGKLVSMATRGRPENVSVTMHLCRGNSAGAWLAEGSYDFVAESLFNDFDVDGYFLEYDSERAGDFSPLRFVDDKSIIVLGLITTKTPENDDRDTLLRRIEEASHYVKLDNLCLSPQCGFASAAKGNPVTFDDQKRKLELMLEVADEVWGLD